MADLNNYETLLVERRRFAVLATFNRPEVRNALSAQMWSEIDHLFASVREDRSVRAIVLRGAGGNFSAGGDLKERDRIGDRGDADATARRNAAGGEIIMRVDRAPQVVVAVVEGHTLGGGFGLACAADIVIADESVKLRLPEISLGIPPAQIAPYIVRRVGLARARRLALTSATIRGQEALSIGLVDFLCAGTDDLERQIAAILDDISRAGPNAIGATKELLRVAGRESSEEYIRQAAGMFASAYLSDEGQEGAAAARARRFPSWQDQQP